MRPHLTSDIGDNIISIWQGEMDDKTGIDSIFYNYTNLPMLDTYHLRTRDGHYMLTSNQDDSLSYFAAMGEVDRSEAGQENPAEPYGEHLMKRLGFSQWHFPDQYMVEGALDVASMVLPNTKHLSNYTKPFNEDEKLVELAGKWHELGRDSLDFHDEFTIFFTNVVPRYLELSLHRYTFNESNFQLILPGEFNRFLVPEIDDYMEKISNLCFESYNGVFNDGNNSVGIPSLVKTSSKEWLGKLDDRLDRWRMLGGAYIMGAWLMVDTFDRNMDPLIDDFRKAVRGRSY